MRTRVVIQSRLNSSRLPGKALISLAGMPLIELVARRASNSGHEVVVATSDEQYDARIAEHLEAVGLEVVRGPLDDVLGRFVTATEGLDDSDLVVRLTGDNPVADGSLIDELVAAVAGSTHEYGRVDIDQVPEGFGAEIFPAGLLREAARTAEAAYDREHVTPWIRRHRSELLFVPRDAPTDLHTYRCTVDCLDDYDRVCGAFAQVDDPVHMPWRDLVARIGERVLAKAPVLARAGGVSPLILGSGSLPRDGADLRALFTTAVTHGVSHVLLHDEAAQQAFRAGTDPALKQRLSAVARVALPGSDAPELALDLLVERMLSHLGRRVDTVVVDPDGDLSRVPAAVSRLAAHLEAGTIGRLGVVLAADEPKGSELPMDGLGWIHLSAGAAAPESALADGSVIVTRDKASGETGTVVVDAASSAELLQAITEVSQAR